MRTAHRFLILLGFAGAVLVFAGACGAAEAPTATPAKAPEAVATPTPAPVPTPTPPGVQPKYGGVFVQAQRADPAPWDPMFGADITVLQVEAPMFGNGVLVKPCWESVYKICPALAEKWESNADFTQWTFKVRESVYWHDGTLLTPEDLKFYIELMVKGVQVGDKKRNPGNFRLGFEPLKSIEVLEGNRLRINLERPVPQYLQGLSTPRFALAHPRHLMKPEIDKGNVTVSPDQTGNVGTGPFKFLKYEKGSVAQVRKFDKYWEKDQRGGQLPYLDGIDLPIIKDPIAMDAAFRTGRVEATSRGSGFHLTPERKAGIEVSLGQKAWFAYVDYLPWILWTNSLKAPWSDVRVRKALTLWMDRQAGIRAVHGGYAKLGTWMGPNSPWVNADFLTWPGYNEQTREKDRAEAKRLLSEGGYAAGVKTDFLCWQLWGPWCEYVEAQLTGLFGQGNVRLELIDTAAWNQRVCDATYQLTIAGIVGLWPQETATYFSPENRCARIKTTDEKIKDAYVQLGSAKDVPSMVDIFRNLERYVLQEQAYAMVMWWEIAVLGFRDYVKGVLIPQESVFNFTDQATVWLDK